MSSSSTYSEYVLNLVEPSISTLALGEAVPNPVVLLNVVNAEPTLMLVAVMIPVRISPDELSSL